MTLRVLATAAALAAGMQVGGVPAAKGQNFAPDIPGSPFIPWHAFYDYYAIPVGPTDDGPSMGDVVGGASPLEAPGADAPLDPSSLRFRHSPEVTDEVRREVAARFAAEAPGRADEIAAEFAQADVVGEFRRMIARYGYDPDDLSHAMAAFLILQWEVLTGGTADAAQMAGAATQISGNLRRTPALAAMGDAEKQRVADALAYQAILSVLVARDLAARGDSAGLEQLRAGVLRGTRELGWDFARLELTGKGFVAR